MKVFISWSGEKSKAVASVVQWWLGMVHPAAKPWVSTVDIQAGDRWANEIEKGLDGAAFGIICVTPQNVDSRWINYEAGAISKQVAGVKAKVATLLIDYNSPTELEMPLSQFNAVMPTQAGFQDLALSINSALEERDQRDAATVRDLAEMVWEKVGEKLDAIEVSEPDETPRKREDSELLEEVLLRVRGLDARIDEISNTAQGNSDWNDWVLRDRGPEGRLSGVGRAKSLHIATRIVRENLPDGMDPRQVIVDSVDKNTIRVLTPETLSNADSDRICSAVFDVTDIRNFEMRVRPITRDSIET